MEAELVWECRENDEAITGLAIGNFTNTKYREILYCCYSGKIKSICHRAGAKQIGLAEATAERIIEQVIKP